jgi:hypothetical protein
LDERAFLDANGLQGFLVFNQKSFVRGGFFRREKHGAAGEPGFDGVEGDFGFARFGAWAGRVPGVGAVGGEAGFGSGGFGHGGDSLKLN